MKAAIEFLKKADRDPSLREQVQRALSEEGRAITSFLATAAEHGYVFTAEEFLAALDEVQGSSASGASGELSDECLEAVTGGTLNRDTIQLAAKAKQVIRNQKIGPSIREVNPRNVVREAEEEPVEP